MSGTLKLTIQRMPMLRLLLPFIAGILVQWYVALPFFYMAGLALMALLLLLINERSSAVQHFRQARFTGLLLHLLVFATGAIFTWQQDIRNAQQWIGHYYQPGQTLRLTLEEPLVEKANSYKALARIETVYDTTTARSVKGQVILYFKKDSTTQLLGYGSQIITARPLQPIRNNGNPGGFDFQQYSLWQGTTHQLYLTHADYKILPSKQVQILKQWIFYSREAIINTLQQYIPGDKEQGLAEALLIGYKDDLDKKLVQSYSNTGVVHVIAISGLHLGIIYWLLLAFTRPLKQRSFTWLRFFLVIAGLWMFSLLAGAQPSVLRSAVMFSCLAFSIVLNRKGSIFNTLALSAFTLLCYNPFWLWDVGFQLSYAAVLSILLFFKPIYNWCYFPNRLFNAVWKLITVSLSAQILTLPISIYYFHQFPVLFLFSNLVAVPLSSAILIGEILLCLLAFLPTIASWLGKLLHISIQWMNLYVERLDLLPFTVWKNLSITPLQTLLLYISIAGLAFWLLNKKTKAVWMALCSLVLFIALRTYSFVATEHQRQLIVYNIPKHQAIDIIQGRQLSFIGSEDLLQDEYLYKFHLQPSRLLHRLGHDQQLLRSKAFTLGNKHCLIIDTTIQIRNASPKPVIDVLVLSKNPKLYLEKIATALSIKQLVIDGSVPRWKANLWKRSAVALRIPFYDVTEKGAFVMPF
jgi:competence protein ComEC